MLDLITTTKQPLSDAYCAPAKLPSRKVSGKQANNTNTSSRILSELLQTAHSIAPAPIIMTTASINQLGLLLNFAERCVWADKSMVGAFVFFFF